MAIAIRRGARAINQATGRSSSWPRSNFLYYRFRLALPQGGAFLDLARSSASPAFELRA